jgi:hypothetical protein
VKIRSKLLLLEGSISLILLTALIFSVFAFINIFSLNEIYETSLSEKNRLRNFRLLVEDILYFPNQSSENFFYVIERWENVYFSSDKEIISLTKGASKDELIEQYNILIRTGLIFPIKIFWLIRNSISMNIIIRVKKI